MKRPKSDDRRRLFGRRHPSVDETLVDYGQSGATGVGAQTAGRSVLQVSVSTDVGRVRRNNEDFVQAAPVVREGRRYALWAVADGVGGGPQGELASRTAVETVVDYLTHEPWTDPATALTDAFALANRNVFEITGEGAAASTMVVALVTEPEGVVCIANVGDSRAYIIAGGEARQITDDHSIVAARVAAGQITAAEARTAADRNVVTRSIGSEREVLVDIFGPRQLQPNERLVLCTDGVHGMIDDAAIARLSRGLAIGEAATALVKAAVEAGGRDNATALVGGYGPAAAAIVPAMTGAAGARVAVGTAHRLPPLAILAALFTAFALALVALIALAFLGGGSVATPSPSSSHSLAPALSASASVASPGGTTSAGASQATPTQSPHPPTPKPTTKPPTPPMPTPTAPVPTPTAPMPTAGPAFDVTLVAEPPAAFPGSGTFSVVSVPNASCTLLAESGGVTLDATPDFTTKDDGTQAVNRGAEWEVSGRKVTVFATCKSGGNSVTSDSKQVDWP